MANCTSNLLFYEKIEKINTHFLASTCMNVKTMEGIRHFSHIRFGIVLNNPISFNFSSKDDNDVCSKRLIQEDSKVENGLPDV